MKTLCPLLAVAHAAKEWYFAIYDAPNRQAATALFASWKTSIDPTVERWFGKVPRTTETWHKQIFNYRDFRFTNGYTESLNRFIHDVNRIDRGCTLDRLRRPRCSTRRRRRSSG
jgi:transposase